MVWASLFDKIYGCIAGAEVGSALGAPIEGWSIERVQKEIGFVDKLLPRHGLPPGTTEDGVERIRLMCNAIIDKGGRITVDDLAKAWLKYIKPESFGPLMLWADKILYELVKTGIPPADVGKYSNWPGIVSFARSCYPIGIINACNPQQAVIDAFDVGRIYQPINGYGLDWAAAVAAGVAEAMKPDATVDSVVEAAVANVADVVRTEILGGIEIARKSKDVFDMRPVFYEHYKAEIKPFANYTWIWDISMSYEIVTKGFAIFYVTKGDLMKSLIGAANFGRDTDCLCAVSGGLSGAFSGIGGMPKDWIETVDKATKMNSLTVSQRTLKETATGLFEAVKKNMESMEKQIRYLKQQI
ncbi:MAG: ADP-ribosylglycohydrolase family protein [Candidatus Bathyarchaeia archaeon]|nr:ADP-ribosylglycohydrolase family protein [Candidatus Bathyarchaeota archaeon]